mmetsp:Transcript_6949/g.20481  ORF Transcript_6949/g.20481 Transcript_6949/m.20481 type:complete len:664 (+) Transcript_6949:98-2089(+)
MVGCELPHHLQAGGARDRGAVRQEVLNEVVLSLRRRGGPALGGSAVGARLLQPLVGADLLLVVRRGRRRWDQPLLEPGLDVRGAALQLRLQVGPEVVHAAQVLLVRPIASHVCEVRKVDHLQLHRVEELLPAVPLEVGGVEAQEQGAAPKAQPVQLLHHAPQPAEHLDHLPQEVLPELTPAGIRLALEVAEQKEGQRLAHRIQGDPLAPVLVVEFQRPRLRVVALHAAHAEAQGCRRRQLGLRDHLQALHGAVSGGPLPAAHLQVHDAGLRHLVAQVLQHDVLPDVVGAPPCHPEGRLVVQERGRLLPRAAVGAQRRRGRLGLLAGLTERRRGVLAGAEVPDLLAAQGLGAVEARGEGEQHGPALAQLRVEAELGLVEGFQEHPTALHRIAFRRARADTGATLGLHLELAAGDRLDQAEVAAHLVLVEDEALLRVLLQLVRRRPLDRGARLAARADAPRRLRRVAAKGAARRLALDLLKKRALVLLVGVHAPRAHVLAVLVRQDHRAEGLLHVPARRRLPGGLRGLRAEFGDHAGQAAAAGPERRPPTAMPVDGLDALLHDRGEIRAVAGLRERLRGRKPDAVPLADLLPRVQLLEASAQEVPRLDRLPALALGAEPPEVRNPLAHDAGLLVGLADGAVLEGAVHAGLELAGGHGERVVAFLA